jgi:hypothetical protein
MTTMPIENQPAAMIPPSVSNAVSQQLAELSDLPISSLKTIWRRHYQVPVPKGMSRDLLTRFIAHRIQEKAFGGLSKSTLRRLETLARSFEQPESKAQGSAPSLKPGTKLVREWGGAAHTVIILDDGFEYRGKRYGSLTRVAAAISGLHRSGPAFFGLKRPLPRFVPRGQAGSELRDAAHE